MPPDGIIYTIDHFQGCPELYRHEISASKLPTLKQQCLFNIEHSKVKHKIRVIDAPTLDVEIDGVVDLVYVDASHETHNAIADIEYYYPKVRNGGIICGDDYNWTSVYDAVEKCKYILPEVQSYGNGRIWYCQKRS